MAWPRNCRAQPSRNRPRASAPSQRVHQAASARGREKNDQRNAQQVQQLVERLGMTPAIVIDPRTPGPSRQHRCALLYRCRMLRPPTTQASGSRAIA